MATNIQILPPGSVQFDDVGADKLRGAVRNPVIRSFTHGRGKEAEPTPGSIVYQSDLDGYVSNYWRAKRAPLFMQIEISIHMLHLKRMCICLFHL